MAAVHEAVAAVEALYEEDSLQRAHDESLRYREARAEEKASFITTIPLLYGELALRDFCELLSSPSLLAAREGDTFVDLGSGTGKLVLTAAALIPLKLSYGIELIPELHKAATHALAKLQPAARKAQSIEFAQGDFFENIRWCSDADMVYCCTTSFTPELMDKLARLAEKLKVGSAVVTISYALPSSLFEVTWKGERECSWGKATVIIQRKRHNRRAEASLLRAMGFKTKAAVSSSASLSSSEATAKEEATAEKGA